MCGCSPHFRLLVLGPVRALLLNDPSKKDILVDFIEPKSTQIHFFVYPQTKTQAGAFIKTYDHFCRCAYEDIMQGKLLAAPDPLGQVGLARVFAEHAHIATYS